MSTRNATHVKLSMQIKVELYHKDILFVNQIEKKEKNYNRLQK